MIYDNTTATLWMVGWLADLPIYIVSCRKVFPAHVFILQAINLFVCRINIFG